MDFISRYLAGSVIRDGASGALSGCSGKPDANPDAARQADALKPEVQEGHPDPCDVIFQGTRTGTATGSTQPELQEAKIKGLSWTELRRLR